MLEEGKIYCVKTASNNRWLFKKESTSVDVLTSCTKAMCLQSDYYSLDAIFICSDSSIIDIRLANENQIAMWNKKFDDNIDITRIRPCNENESALLDCYTQNGLSV